MISGQTHLQKPHHSELLRFSFTATLAWLNLVSEKENIELDCAVFKTCDTFYGFNQT